MASPVRGRRGLLVGVILGLGVVGVVAVGGWAPARLPVDGPPSTDEPYPVDPGRPLVRLAVAGDVGTGEAEAWATAAVMDRIEGSREFDALLLLGDNIYPDGDVSRVGPAVLDPFAGVLDGSTALLAALGNHDVRTADGVPQLDALGMPGRWYETRIGPVAVVVLDSTRVGDPEQLAWAERALASAQAANAPWTVVMQHHPPLSAGYHGSHESSRRLLVPLFERFGVDLVLAGHDHDYQRSTPQNGVVYIVSGGAAKLRPTGTADFTASAASLHHFVELAVFADRLELRAVDQRGRVFDTYVQPADGAH